jgi:hypothetical protein
VPLEAPPASPALAPELPQAAAKSAKVKNALPRAADGVRETVEL